VNVNHTTDDFPMELRELATSLQLETRRAFDRSALAVAILKTFHEWEDRLANDFASVVEAARRRSSLIGKTVAVQCADNRIEGRAIGLDVDGKLRVELPDGNTETFGSGEASIVKFTN
jgi:BirA family biotin operon repressor/biotin-[acetyl-CoA-carboxylase] ligase